MNNSVHVCGIYDTTMIILHTEISCVLYNFHSFAQIILQSWARFKETKIIA